MWVLTRDCFRTSCDRQRRLSIVAPGCAGLEQTGEWAGGHTGADVLGVAGVLEQVCVDVERDRDARVAEDTADLGRVEPEVADQVAGEGVAEVVEAKLELRDERDVVDGRGSWARSAEKHGGGARE